MTKDMYGYQDHSRGPYGGRGGADECARILAEKPDAQIIFIGSVNCLRHKPYWSVAKYMREGKVSLLCPTMTEFAFGRYMNMVKEAVAELKEERGAEEFVLIHGCQWVILSSDGELLCEDVQRQLGVRLIIEDDSHLEFGDHD